MAMIHAWIVSSLLQKSSGGEVSLAIVCVEAGFCQIQSQMRSTLWAGLIFDGPYDS